MLCLMRVAFTKMHGLGNDFIVYERAADAALPDAKTWRQLADRHAGIGFDQALVLEPAHDTGTVAYYRIFNSDGSEVEQCGNGARCVARWLVMHGRSSGAASDGEALAMGSPGGRVAARVLADGRVAVDLGEPRFEPAALPFLAPARASRYDLDVAGEQLTFGAVSMGNPHAVLQVADVASAPVARLGPALQQHAKFPRQVNVGFMQVLAHDRIWLRVYERGAGETLACGTGACAAVAVGRDLGLLGPEVEVNVPGGRLGVHWEGAGHSAWLTGPAEVAFTGEFELPGIQGPQTSLM
jgi:diaminopimelate epimerase